MEKEKYTTENILVGNISNPENIIIAHFDSIVGDGALDNAAAIAVMIETIKQKAVVLQNTLLFLPEMRKFPTMTTKSKVAMVLECLSQNIVMFWKTPNK